MGTAGGTLLTSLSTGGLTQHYEQFIVEALAYDRFAALGGVHRVIQHIAHIEYAAHPPTLIAKMYELTDAICHNFWYVSPPPAAREEDFASCSLSPFYAYFANITDTLVLAAVGRPARPSFGTRMTPMSRIRTVPTSLPTRIGERRRTVPHLAGLPIPRRKRKTTTNKAGDGMTARRIGESWT